MEEPPSLSPSRVLNSTSSSRHEEVVYEVRVKVMGLAGITVDRSKCRGTTRKIESPVEPEQMNAVVTVLQGHQIHAVTAPSKSLKRSPADEVEVVEPTLDFSPDSERHIALWDNDKSTGGSVVFLEAKVKRSTSGNAAVTAAYARLAKQNFSLVVGLFDPSSPQGGSYARSIGITELVVSADQANKGSIKLDLPVHRVPSGRFAGDSFPVIPQTRSNTTEPTKKKNGIGRMFSKKDAPAQDHEESDGTFTLAAPSSFAEAYTVGVQGDAIIRLEMEVHEKEFNYEVGLGQRSSAPELYLPPDPRRIHTEAVEKKLGLNTAVPEDEVDPEPPLSIDEMEPPAKLVPRSPSSRSYEGSKSTPDTPAVSSVEASPDNSARIGPIPSPGKLKSPRTVISNGSGMESPLSASSRLHLSRSSPVVTGNTIEKTLSHDTVDCHRLPKPSASTRKEQPGTPGLGVFSAIYDRAAKIQDRRFSARLPDANSYGKVIVEVVENRDEVGARASVASKGQSYNVAKQTKTHSQTKTQPKVSSPGPSFKAKSMRHASRHKAAPTKRSHILKKILKKTKESPSPDRTQVKKDKRNIAQTGVAKKIQIDVLEGASPSSQSVPVGGYKRSFVKETRVETKNDDIPTPQMAVEHSVVVSDHKRSIENEGHVETKMPDDTPTPMTVVEDEVLDPEPPIEVSEDSSSSKSKNEDFPEIEHDASILSMMDDIEQEHAQEPSQVDTDTDNTNKSNSKGQARRQTFADVISCGASSANNVFETDWEQFDSTNDANSGATWLPRENGGFLADKLCSAPDNEESGTDGLFTAGLCNSASLKASNAKRRQLWKDRMIGIRDGSLVDEGEAIAAGEELKRDESENTSDSNLEDGLGSILTAESEGDDDRGSSLATFESESQLDDSTLLPSLEEEPLDHEEKKTDDISPPPKSKDRDLQIFKAVDESKKVSVDESSPRGVDEVVEEEEKRRPKLMSIRDQILNVLTCGGGAHDPLDEPTPVPRVLFQNDDNGSLGELTATTYEQQVDGETHQKRVQTVKQAFGVGKGDLGPLSCGYACEKGQSVISEGASSVDSVQVNPDKEAILRDLLQGSKGDTPSLDPTLPRGSLNLQIPPAMRKKVDSS